MEKYLSVLKKKVFVFFTLCKNPYIVYTTYLVFTFKMQIHCRSETRYIPKSDKCGKKNMYVIILS